jgi:serine/threonine protein kinase/Tol biopolymer transport system component
MALENVGRYEITNELGRGGMATVYRAYDPRFEREVAIKVLPHELMHEAQFRMRFEREAKTIARLEHTAIVPVYDVGEEDGVPFFVMRYMPGGSLADRIKGGPLTLEESAHIIDRIASALDSAHAKGIVHRDVKPGNILFDEDNEPFISDFGIAKLSESKTNVTGSAIIGTPAYMSPEQAQGEAVDGRSDIYSLGVILYEMLSGKQPFEANTPMGVVFKHVTEPVPHILDANPSLPPIVERVIEKVMAKQPGDRFQNAASLAEAISAVARGEVPDLSRTIQSTTRATSTWKRGAQSSAEPTAAVMKAGKKTPSFPTPILLGVAGLVLAGVVAFLAFRPFIPGISSLPTAGPPPEIPAATSVSANINPPPGPSVTPALGIGGADKIAFIAGDKIRLMDIDGSGLDQLPAKGANKFDLQWLPDGKTILYAADKCVYTFNIDTKENQVVVCYDRAKYFDGFEISPDSKQVAISLDRELLVVPFDLQRLSQAKTRQALIAMNGCLTYSQVGAKSVRWSSDEQKLAILSLIISGDRASDNIRVIDIHHCREAAPLILDEFPAERFVPTSYGDDKAIPAFDWDGNSLFLFNTLRRNQGYGELYTYDMQTGAAKQINPVNGICCYRDARWSPDRKYLIFAYQNINQGEKSETQLYYIPYDSVGTGVEYKPFSLPQQFFSNPREAPQPALRPPIP